MNNPYISYKVVGDTFTYKRFNSDNVVVEEEIPLFENGKINSVAVQIVENVRQNKNYLEIKKQDIKTKQPIKGKKINHQGKSSTLKKLEIRDRLRNIPSDAEKEEIDRIVKSISDEYEMTTEEINTIHADLLTKNLDNRDLINNSKNDEKEKIISPEKHIKLTLDEYKAVEQFLINISEMPEINKNNLRKKIDEIEAKYNISFIQLRKIFKAEKHNEKEKKQIEQIQSQLKVSEIEKKKDAAKKFIAEFPDNLSNDEITIRMDEIERNLGIPKEDLFDLYEDAKELKHRLQNEKKSTMDLFKAKIAEITSEEIDSITEFLNTVPPTPELFATVSNIRNKYELNDKDLILAYSIRKKQLYNNSKQTVNVNPKLQTERTAKKLEYMIQELKEKNLSDKELAEALNEMAKKYNISQLQMELLYKNAIISKQKNILSDKLSRKLTGKKIAKKKRFRKFVLEENKLDSSSSKTKLIENGSKLVIASKLEDWKEMIEKNYHNPVPIYTAINVMTILNNGGGITQAKKEMEDSHNFNLNKNEIIKIITEYSPYGQEFAKKTRKYIMSKPERLMNFVLDKKASFTKNKDEVLEDFNTEEAIKKLEELRNSIINPEDLGIDNVIEPPSPWKTM